MRELLESDTNHQGCQDKILKVWQLRAICLVQLIRSETILLPTMAASRSGTPGLRHLSALETAPLPPRAGPGAGAAPAGPGSGCLEAPPVQPVCEARGAQGLGAGPRPWPRSREPIGVCEIDHCHWLREDHVRQPGQWGPGDASLAGGTGGSRGGLGVLGATGGGRVTSPSHRPGRAPARAGGA